MGELVNIFAGAMDFAKGGLSMAAGFSDAQSMEALGEYQKQQYEANARIAEIQAADALERGKADAMAVRRKVAAVKGSQTASFAAQGVDVATGSSAALQNETDYFGAMDEITASNNAWREAWGYKVQANNYRGEGSMALAAAKTRAANSILTGGLGALGSFAEGTYRLSGGGSQARGGGGAGKYTGESYNYKSKVYA